MGEQKEVEIYISRSQKYRIARKIAILFEEKYEKF